MASTKGLFWVYLFVLVDVLGFSLILPLMPYYGKEFEASPTTIGLVMTSNALSQALTAPIIGALSDNYGRKPMLLLCLIGTIVGFLLLASAQNIFQIFLSRILDGALGGNIALAQTIAADLTTPDQRARSFGMIGAAFGIGFIIGPAFGGTLATHSSRLPAYVAAIVTVINFIGVYFFLPESLSANKKKEENNSTQKQNGIVNTNKQQKEPLYSAFVAIYRCLKIPVLGELLILRFNYQFVFTLFETSFGFFNLSVLNLDARSSSYLLAFVGILFALVQGGIRAFKNVNEAKMIFYSLCVLSVSLLFWSQSRSMISLLFSLTLLAISSGLLNTLISSHITKHVQTIELGGALGVSSAVGSLTRVFAPVTGGSLIDLFGIWAPGIVGCFIIVGTIVYMRTTKLYNRENNVNIESETKKVT